PPQNQQRALDPFERLLSWRNAMGEERFGRFTGLGRQQRTVEAPNPPGFPNGHNYLRDNYYYPYPYQHPPPLGGYNHHLHKHNHQNDNRRQHPGIIAQGQHNYPPHRVENLPSTLPLVPET